MENTNTNVDFSVLNQKEPLTVGHMHNFYNKEGSKRGFDGVWTEEGYYLANKVAKGRSWLEFHEDMVKKTNGDVVYDTNISVYSEDYATVPQASLVAKTSKGIFAGTKIITSTYIGASEDNHNEKFQEWKESIDQALEYKDQCIELYKQYVNYLEESEIG